MEQTLEPNQQPNQTSIDEQKRQKSKTMKIALLAFGVFVLIVGGILLFKALSPSSPPTQPVAPVPIPTQLSPGEEIILQGIVKENHREGAAIDLPAWLEVETPHGIFTIEYHFGHSSVYCLNTTAEAFGFGLKKSERIEIFGKFQGSGVDVCSSERYYMKRIEDTSTWQAYRNDEFGFEVKYPQGWITHKISLESFGTVIKIENTQSESYFVIAENKNDEQLSLDDWFRKTTIVSGRPTAYASADTVIINGAKAYRLDSKLKPPNPLFVVYIADEMNRIFAIFTDSVSLQDSEILNQILSTFRFVDESNL